MSQFLLVAGVLLLSMAFRSIAHPLAQRCAFLALLTASYLIGFYLSGSWQVGALCVVSWFLLPWVEILTRVRRMRLSTVEKLKSRFAPGRDDFPALVPLTEELEEAGFEKLDDAGWDWGEQAQFVRLFAKEDEALQATICLVDQENFAFYYLSLTSRRRDGALWTTWNYPFSYAMKLPPSIRVQRVPGEAGVEEMLEAHRRFLEREGVEQGSLEVVDAEGVIDSLQRDLEMQIDHNLKVGLLRPGEEGSVRYSWRGCFFIWCQFLRDFVRLS